MYTYSKFNETPQKFQVKTELNIRKRPSNKLVDSSKATRHRVPGMQTLFLRGKGECQGKNLTGA